MKVTFDIDPRSLPLGQGRGRAHDEASGVVAEALAGWLELREDDEDRASAADALADTSGRRTAAADFFEHLAAEARAEYGSRD